MGAVLAASAFAVDPAVVLVAAAVFGLLAFSSARRFERRTGAGPWRLDPQWWLVIGFLIGVFGVGLCLVAQRWGSGRPPVHEPPWPGRGPPPGHRVAPTGAPREPGRPEGPPPVGPEPGRAGPPPGWFADPSGQYALRYWDGGAWTGHVAPGPPPEEPGPEPS
jgi:hypothetical protein